MTPDQRTAHTIDTEPSSRQVLALDLLHIAANAYRTTPTEGCDRALAHAIRCAQRAGLTWRTICSELRMSEQDTVLCIGRWPGDN